MRIDLHVHTCHSDDSLTTLRALERWITRRRLDAVAITDHNAIAGAQALRARLPQSVIVGEEIRTTHGEISGLYLESEIPAGLSPRETVARIRAQGGLVYLPHPFDRLRGLRLDGAELQRLLEQVDIIEVFNPRVTWAADNRLARACATREGILFGAGSDAHMGVEIGRAYVDLPRFEGAAGLVAALTHGQVGGRMSGPWVHLGSRLAHWVKLLRPAASESRSSQP